MAIKVGFKHIKKMKVCELRELYKTLGVDSKEEYMKQLKRMEK